MKAKLIVLAGIVAMAFTACNNDDDEPMVQGQDFKVTIENVSEAKEFLQSGVFNTPVGANEPGGAGPGHSYEFSFYAGPGHKVSFATMFVKSNDLFYAPSGTGIELYN
ncbi:MAG: spondin domain-containing protein, partial [Carboxylicivirga sp.]|nr:spondin domain-containing protein [Carboxylicivirga sp.]